MTPITANAVQDQFVELMGQLAEMCSFSRSIGQIYGVLYLSPEPLSLDEIATTCRMSKGNASIHLRTLEAWGAVHLSGKTGTRKDYYVANRDLRALMLKRLHEGLGRRIDHARTKFAAIQQDPNFAAYVKSEGSFAGDRVKDIESLLIQVEKAAAMLPKLLAFKSFF